MEKKNITIFLIILAALIFLMIFLKLLFGCLNPSISIVKTNPKEGNTSWNPEDIIEIYFSEKPNLTLFQIETNPSFDFEVKWDNSKKALLILPKAPLLEQTEYKITLKKIGRCAPVKELKNKDFSFSFKTRLSSKNQEWEENKNKLISSTTWPIETPDYNIDYWPQKDSFLVFIKNNPCNVVKEKVLNWFKGKGVNFDKINIIWTVGKNVSEECF